MKQYLFEVYLQFFWKKIISFDIGSYYVNKEVLEQVILF